ncbi:hypothetical protein [Rhizobium straminoryzae]|uniref:Uncharacterized protein n=1 Tax=Rhizobium straminoryzae TaxID=1387186 RepID=A0A549T0S1_9HYPH|nr:hypothetical protein [Rhizobium straminoryzae]TRL35473.1 hypothetical protein FNA46_19925 [Rhizobium straminoryzae]
MKDLGFGGKLSDIKPDTEPAPSIPERRLDEVAERHGFVSRQPTQQLRRRQAAEPSANLNIRPPISTYNRFVSWAMENRLSYPEALRELMDRAKID